MTTEKTTLSSDSTLEFETQSIQKMDVANRRLAKQIHDLWLLHFIYGGLDGLSNNLSWIKLVFDFHYANSSLSSSEEMYKWFLTPEGAVIAATTSIGLVVFSMLANHFDDEDKNAIKRYIAIIWPYVRDLKALKNAYKGFKSTLLLAKLLGATADVSYLVNPIGIALGVLSFLNRIWYRRMVSDRKDMMKANAKYLDDIQNPQDKITLQLLEDIEKAINRQSTFLRFSALASAFYGGLTDAQYLYVGVFTLCSLPPPLLLAMTVFTAIYFLFCIATRVYEEYDFQQKLVISQVKLELALEGKRIELRFEKLRLLSAKLALDPENEMLRAKQSKIGLYFDAAFLCFKEKQNELRTISARSYGEAFLIGAKNGLSAYGALAALLFVIGMMAPFPPYLLVSAIVLGMVLLIGFIAHSLDCNYQHRKKCEQKKESKTKFQLFQLGTFKEALDQVKDLRPEVVRTAILDGMVVDPSPQFFFQELFEIIRSFASAMGKGLRYFNSDKSPLIITLMVVSASVHTIIFALRAYARGFGRKAIDAVSLKDDTENELVTFKSSEDFVYETYLPLAKVKPSTSRGQKLKPTCDNRVCLREDKFPLIKNDPSKSKEPKLTGISKFSFFNKVNASNDTVKARAMSSPMTLSSHSRKNYSEPISAPLKNMGKSPSLSDIIPDSGLDHCTF
ncbi:MAG: hypothetical protein H0U70_07435 [Tatlockia sp.]|nr:hypothetical protein [Tatlockia sp.]